MCEGTDKLVPETTPEPKVTPKTEAEDTTEPEPLCIRHKMMGTVYLNEQRGYSLSVIIRDGLPVLRVALPGHDGRLKHEFIVLTRSQVRALGTYMFMAEMVVEKDAKGGE